MTAQIVTHPDELGHATTRHHEHGQDWLMCLCGATWSVVICAASSAPDAAEWEDYERIDDGDGECEAASVETVDDN